MKYFIDFEATQFSNEIISIGCSREDGKEFYSLVKPEKRKLTKFITNLTGITQEMVDEAPTADEVFSQFFDYLEGDSELNFYCYGNTDIDFIKKTLENTTDFKATAALSMIGMNLKDYSKSVKLHFGLHRNIGLVKVLAYYRGVDEIHQDHNALEDAKYLREVFLNIENEEFVEGDPFPEYKAPQVQNPPKKGKTNNDYSVCMADVLRIERKKAGIIEESYETIEEAIAWCLKEMPEQSRTEAAQYPNRISNKIKKAFKKNSKYMNYKWNIILDEEKGE
jgi:inhibitor of KinA sporulation pathway (predicted exonuclease)